MRTGPPSRLVAADLCGADFFVKGEHLVFLVFLLDNQ
jgi:hypothetical protein